MQKTQTGTNKISLHSQYEQTIFSAASRVSRRLFVRVCARLIDRSKAICRNTQYKQTASSTSGCRAGKVYSALSSATCLKLTRCSYRHSAELFIYFTASAVIYAVFPQLGFPKTMVIICVYMSMNPHHKEDRQLVGFCFLTSQLRQFLFPT